ncbi:MAG: helix-turn-helix domain-containing protein [Gemmatimonadales bacterium]
MSAEFTETTGNVFEDLGFGKPEAENLRIRSLLMGALRELIAREDLTQTRAAEIFGVTQPRISDLVRGKIELFSIDALVNMLAAAGRGVRVSVEEPSDRAA